MAIKLDEFLAFHNRLSSSDFQATMEEATRFRAENIALFEDDNLTMEELRRSFLVWLNKSLKKAISDRSRKGGWVTFPRPSDQ